MSNKTYLKYRKMRKSNISRFAKILTCFNEIDVSYLALNIENYMAMFGAKYRLRT